MIKLKNLIKEDNIPSGFKKINTVYLDDKKIKWGITKVYYKSYNGNKIGTLKSSYYESERKVYTYRIDNETINPADIIAVKY